MEWTKEISNYYDMNTENQTEFKNSIKQTASRLLLRNWQETCEIFLHYIRHSPSSPYTNAESIFARHEYQKKTGNLSLRHLMIQINWSSLSEEKRKVFDEIIRASICDIAKIEDLQPLK
jgi:hypothetical protein